MLRLDPLRAWHFRRQVPIGPYYADFASHKAKLIIEVDGGQHFADAAQAYDARRDAFLRTRGYRVVRFVSTDVLNNITGVAEMIVHLVGPVPPNPPAL